MQAAAYGSLDMMKMLLDAGVDVNAKNHFDATALLWCARNASKARFLIEHGAPQLIRLIRHGYRVQVDDAVDRGVAAVLAGHVLGDRADVVAQVLASRGLDAGEDPHERGSLAAARRASFR